MLDSKMQQKFNGDWGRAAYDESLVFLGMFAAHGALKRAFSREYHGTIDGAWYATLIPNFPGHNIRGSMQSCIGRAVDPSYDPNSNAGRIFASIGEAAHRKIRQWAGEKNHDHSDHQQVKDQWFDSNVRNIETYIDDVVTRYSN